MKINSTLWSGEWSTRSVSFSRTHNPTRPIPLLIAEAHEEERKRFRRLGSNFLRVWTAVHSVTLDEKTLKNLPPQRMMSFHSRPTPSWHWTKSLFLSKTEKRMERISWVCLSYLEMFKSEEKTCFIVGEQNWKILTVVGRFGPRWTGNEFMGSKKFFIYVIFKLVSLKQKLKSWLIEFLQMSQKYQPLGFSLEDLLGWPNR